MDGVLGNMKLELEQMGGVLALDVNNNPDLRNAMAREIIGEKAAKEESASYKDMKSDMPTDEGFESEWEVFKNSKAGWSALPDAEKLLRRDEFAKSYEDKLKEKTDKKRGFWAHMFRATFNLFDVNTKKANLKL